MLFLFEPFSKQKITYLFCYYLLVPLLCHSFLQTTNFQDLISQPTKITFQTKQKQTKTKQNKKYRVSTTFVIAGQKKIFFCCFFCCFLLRKSKKWISSRQKWMRKFFDLLRQHLNRKCIIIHRKNRIFWILRNLEKLGTLN